MDLETSLTKLSVVLHCVKCSDDNGPQSGHIPLEVNNPENIHRWTDFWNCCTIGGVNDLGGFTISCVIMMSLESP